jgi:hypothetical protein
MAAGGEHWMNRCLLVAKLHRNPHPSDSQQHATINLPMLLTM